MAWLFIDGDPPPSLGDRARLGALVHLTADELAGVVGNLGSNGRDLLQNAIAEMLSQGFSTRAIANRTGLSERTVQRRIALLREEFGAQPGADLSDVLRSRGFGGTS